MKKVMLWLLAAVMLFTFAACSGKGNLEGEATENEGVVDGGNPDNTETPENSQNNENPIKTIGQRLADDFKNLLNLDNMMGARAMVDELLKGDYVSFETTTTEVQPGKLKGFGDAEITGFKEGVMVTSSKADDPFIAYIFTLDEDTDAEQFMSTLKAKADVAWNTKVKADEMLTEGMGKKVLFVMHAKETAK